MAAPISPGRMILGILLIAGGAIAGIGFLVFSVIHVFTSLEPLGPPGIRNVSLKPGRYTMYWETRGMFREGVSGSDLELRLTDSHGAAVPVDTTGVLNSHYSVGSRMGVSVAGFSVDREDRYLLLVGPKGGKKLPDGEVVLSPDLGLLGVLKIVLGTLLLIGAGALSGLVVLLKRPKESPTPA